MTVSLTVTLSLSAPFNYVRGQCFQQLSLCNGTSVGTLAAYTSNSAKNCFGNQTEESQIRSPFYYSTFPIFICYKKPSATPPPWAERYIVTEGIIWIPNLERGDEGG